MFDWSLVLLGAFMGLTLSMLIVSIMVYAACRSAGHHEDEATYSLLRRHFVRWASTGNDQRRVAVHHFEAAEW
jgi:hypothetical protein